MPIKARASSFYRKAQRTAGAIVDLQNLLHVAVGGVARILPCIFGDGFGVHRGEPCNQTLPAVLIPVHCHKVGNAVEDTGEERIGIAEEDLPRIFEKGFTGYNGRANKKSTGIGLYLCKSIIDRLHHTIWIESKPEKGTKVYLNFDREHRRIE